MHWLVINYAVYKNSINTEYNVFIDFAFRKSKEDVSRISFMGNEIDPYAMLLQKMRSLGLNEESKSKESSSQSLSTFVSALNEMYDLKRNSELYV